MLQQALDDPEPLVREHAAWALERLSARVSGERGNSDPPGLTAMTQP